MLVTDAYGGFGGISKFNRDFMASCASRDLCHEVVALPRVISGPITEPLPQRLRYSTNAANGKISYALTLCSTLLANRRFDMVICGHIHLLPLAWAVSQVSAAPLVLIVHGIEAWQPTSRRLVNTLAGKIDYLIAVSQTTKERFLTWAPLRESASFILPNSIDMIHFQPRIKNLHLLNRHNLHGKTVMMSLARLKSSERYKGIDEVLEVFPELCRNLPNLVYLIAGTGDDLTRLQEKVRVLGVHDRVIFTGRVSENEKVDYYNLADAFVMPGRGEGFGIVYLEAMACGVPVVASALDGSREALLDGKLGVLVNPLDPASIKQGICEALSRGKDVPLGLDYFSGRCFHERVQGIFDQI
jgi:glycosyltransferase involved in cell wall biosynthesis